MKHKAIVQAMLLFFLKYRMGLEAQSDLIAGTVFVVALLALPFWAWASHHWDKRLAYVGGVAFWAAVQLVLVIIRPGWGMPVVLTLAALAGIGVGAAHVLPWSIIPDAIEWDELATCQRHEGVFYSMVTLMQKIAWSVAIPLALLMLELTGYVPNAPVQLPGTVHGIQVLMGPVPAVLLCCGILFALLYPLSRERHAQVRNELAARRAGAVHAGD
jgi:GPH family glycoside/pentoside/hexuronide:cation symporter